MQNNLVIVESPAKAKTIQKFLGDDFQVMSSYGHIRDLNKKNAGIDIENGFIPHYEVPTDKTTIVKELKAAAKKSEIVWLASDEDREGEAISWHLSEVLQLDPEKTRRIVFHEITKTAILDAVAQPRTIDTNLVNAQQARRLLDRLVGFELSPVLWKKVKPQLSAGRVQSVAVRLIVEREREINSFIPEASFRVVAVFLVPDGQGRLVEMKAELSKRFATAQEAQQFLEHCAQSTFRIDEIKKTPTKKSPAAPFTTSTLQQEASRKLGLPVARTMSLAQKLYESGQITYMRTDSVNLSNLAINTSKSVITEKMGAEYVQTRQFTTKSKGAQEAHEAIRPTDMSVAVLKTGTPQEKRLYELIWKRTLASQMAPAQLEKTTATISVSGEELSFVAVGEVITFDGFLKVYRESFDDDSEDTSSSESSNLLPSMQEGQFLEYKQMVATERFSQQPPRYSEASLVRKLEELGIGRPSTYAPTISTIQKRAYVERGEDEGMERAYQVMTLSGDQLVHSQESERYGSNKNRLVPTDIGVVVNDFLMQHFPNIMDYNFTANIEREFDEIAEGDKVWNVVLKDFYEHFHPNVDKTLALKSEQRVGERVLGVDPKTGRNISVKIGRYGPVAQLGLPDEEEKPVFAQLRKGQSIQDISLEEALELFKLPREVGEYEGYTVKIGVGRFGPYIYHHAKYVSIPKELDPLDVTLDECIDLIEKKRKADAEKHIKSFDEEPELQILNGRWGPYIAYQKVNYKIPKAIESPAELTLEQCMELIKKEEASPSGKRKASARAAANKKKTATKKKKATSKTGAKKNAKKATPKT